jgi:hypothetical protein
MECEANQEEAHNREYDRKGDVDLKKKKVKSLVSV